MINVIKIAAGVSIPCVPILLLILILRGRGRDLLCRLESTPATSPEFIELVITYLRRRTRTLRFCVTVIAFLIVVVPCVWALVARPNPRILVQPLADIVLLMIVVFPMFWWRWYRGANRTLDKLAAIELEPTPAAQFSALDQLRHDLGLERDLWLVYDQKRVLRSGNAD
jgi:hypothetical protein